MVPAWTRPKRVRKYGHMLWSTTILAPLNGSSSFVHRAMASSSRPRNSVRFRSKTGRDCGATRTSPLEDVRGDGRRHARVERVVRVAERVHVAHRSVHAGRRDLEDHDALGRVDATGRTGDHPGIVGALDDDVGPLVELEAVHDEQVGPAHLDHEARAHFEVVRILIAAREGVDLDEIAARPPR